MFRIEAALGPATTPPALQKIENRKTFISFFDDENFLSREVLFQHPSAILGRRGSGKTAILYHIRFRGGYDFVSKIESSNAFTDVSADIEKRLGGAGSAGASLVENSARIWRALIFTTVICRVYSGLHKDSRHHNEPEIVIIREFLRKNGFLNLRLYHAIWRGITKIFETTAKMKYNVGEDFSFFSDFLEKHFRQEGGFDEAWDATLALLQKSSSRSLVLIDSLEQFPIHRFDMRAAMSGLLHFVGELDLEALPVKVCVCFPAELHEDLWQISDNPEKDFERVLTLHWEAHELFQLCGHRFDIFRKHSKIESLISANGLPEKPNRDDIWVYWNQFLPNTLTNRQGNIENTISYITRHTQLLPRHLLHIMNKIVMIALKRDNEYFEIIEEDIVEGVRLGEGNICLGVIDGFKQKYPLARDLIKLLVPNLSNVFSYEQLAGVNKTFGFSIERDTSEVLDMFVRMGIVGRLTEDRTDRYHRSRFDYTFNGQMPYSPKDLFTLHPAFSGQFKSMVEMSETVRAVYPIEEFSGKRRGVGQLFM